jgi:ubiquinone/menaquinone biosynthesis C-methylase UbiE
MPSEYEDPCYWERVYDLNSHCNTTTDGNDGEADFDQKILDFSKQKSVLDVGCGDGTFSIKVGMSAKNIAGIDFSENAIQVAKKKLETSGLKNAEFKTVTASSLGFENETFDLVFSRRGPLTHSSKSLSEAYRVLKKGGQLMEITIGELDKENIVRIFGRGQMLHSEKVSILKDRVLKENGFRPLEIKDYVAVEIIPSLKELICRLTDSPIIPNFDPVADRPYLEKVQEICKKPRGSETPTHRVAIIAQKY